MSRFTIRTHGYVYDLAPQRFRELFSDSFEKLKELLDGLIKLNASYSKAQFTEDVQMRIRFEIERLLQKLCLVNYKGYVPGIPMTNDVSVGDAVILEADNGLYICVYANQQNGDIKWRRILCEEDLSAYYTKAEFDEIYKRQFGLLSAFIDDKLNICLSSYANIFVTKAEADARLSSQLEYINAINEVNFFRAEQQFRVDELEADVAVLHREFDRITADLLSGMASWKLTQAQIMSAAIKDCKDEAIRMKSEVNDRLSSIEDELYRSTQKLNYVNDEVSLLSAAYIRARNGEQRVIEEHYEA